MNAGVPGLRVLLVLGTSTGGIGRHVRSLAAALVEAGDEVRVAGPASTNEAFGFEQAGASFMAVEVSTTPRPRLDTVAVRRLRMLAGPCDVVHAHGLRAGFLAVVALRVPGLLAGARRQQPHQRRGRPPLRRRRRPPLVITWHNAMLQRGWRSRALTALEVVAARGADVTLGASADLVERARRLGARDVRLGAVAAPPPRPPARDRQQVRAELLAAGGINDPSTALLLAVGRLAEQKDYPTLLRALDDHWPASVPRPLVLIAGEGPLHDDLQRAADDRGLPVLLLGHRSDVPDLLGAADAYVLCSRWEARALVVQEAARAGLPIVATAVGGVPELIGNAALLVPAEDPAALAEALGRVLTDAGLRRRLSEAARLRSAHWPDEQATTGQIRAVYQSLVQRPG